MKRETGEDWKTYLRGLATEEGLEDLDRRRTAAIRQGTARARRSRTTIGELPNDPDSRIARLKDGTTHATYKAEHVVDLDTDLVLAAVIYEADRGRYRNAGRERGVQAQLNVIAAESPANIEEAVADKRLPRGRDGGLGQRDIGRADVHFRALVPQSTLEVERAVGG